MLHRPITELTLLGQLMDAVLNDLIDRKKGRSWTEVVDNMTAGELLDLHHIDDPETLAMDLRLNMPLLQLLRGQRTWERFLQEELGSLPERSLMWHWEGWLSPAWLRVQAIAEVVVLFGSDAAAATAIGHFHTMLVECRQITPTVYEPTVIGAAIERVIINTDVLRVPTVWVNLLMHGDAENCRYFIEQARAVLNSRGNTQHAALLREYSDYLLESHCASPTHPD